MCVCVCRWQRRDLTHIAGPGVSLEDSFKYPGSVCVDVLMNTRAQTRAADSAVD